MDRSRHAARHVPTDETRANDNTNHTRRTHELKPTNVDILVIGAGPAGSTAAIACARNNANVLLVDHKPFPRNKVCGCCLNTAGVELLDQLNLRHIAGPQRITNFELTIRARRQSIRLDRAGPSAVCERSTFDHALANAAVEAGATFNDGCSARLLPSDHHADHRRAHLQHADGRTETVHARVVILADGLAGQAAADELGWRLTRGRRERIGAACTIHTETPPDFVRPDTIHMAAGPSGYVGCVALDQHQLCIAAAIAPRAVRQAGSVHNAVQQLLPDAWSDAAVLQQLRSARWHGSPSLRRERNAVASHRVLAIGDACGYREPFTGEGMTWALASGIGVSQLARRAVTHWSPSIRDQWTHEHDKCIRRRQRTCNAISAVLAGPLRGAIVRTPARLGEQCAHIIASPYAKEATPT